MRRLTNRASLIGERIAVHSLAINKDITEACRPPLSIHSHGTCLSQENPRAAIPFASAAYLRVHDRCLQPLLQQSTEPVTPWATRICKRSNQEVAR